MYAVQSASQNFPKLRRLVVNPGIMCPVRARSVGIPGIASTAAPVEVRASPVAVRMVVVGALVLTSITGALGVK
jgi:hypothetical protein